MKIPETSANVGAYYGNEENGQWQPNGVMLDSGVGGGVVGSGDAGVQRAPLYPVHLPRQHMSAGYVMAGAYYPPAPYAAPAPDDFADYMWMENEEEFDKQVMQQLEEEALMEQCIEAMLEDERHNGHQLPTTSNGASLSLEETVSRSRLNPLAAEFVPVGAARAHPAAEEKPETAEPPSREESEESPKREEAPADHTDTSIEPQEPQKEPSPPPSEPPEPEARHKRRGRARAPPAPARAERDELASEHKPTPPAPVEEVQGPKPINYAAAAKANKPKKPASPPADKASPPLAQKQEKKKPEKPVQRKNSAK